VTCAPFRMGKLSKVPGMLWHYKRTLILVREIATFRGKSETAIQFFVFGKFRTNFFSPTPKFA